MTPQYKPLKMNKIKAGNNALPSMPPKPNPQSQRRAARAAVQPFSAKEKFKYE